MSQDCPTEDYCISDDKAWQLAESLFNYELALTTGWLNRRVETWKYRGDSQWGVTVSLDINDYSLRCLYDDIIRNRQPFLQGLFSKDALADLADGQIISVVKEGGSSQPEDCADQEGCPGQKQSEPSNEDDSDEEIIIPLFEVNKNVQFLDFSVTNGSGDAMKLLLRETGCHVAISQLEGAMLAEYLSLLRKASAKFGDNEDLYAAQGNSEAGCAKNLRLSDNVDLLRLLTQVFMEPVLPRREDGTAIVFGAPGFYSDVKSYVERFIDAETSDSSWGESASETLKKDFGEFWERSSVFRYFVALYSTRWLACASVKLADDFSLIKSSFVVVKDIVGAAHKKFIPRTFKSGNVSLDLELSGIGAGEVNHVVVHAPEGTRFTPSHSRENKITGNTEPRKDFPESRFFAVKRLFEKDDNNPSDLEDIGPEALAYGSLTPGCVSVKAQMGWYEAEESKDEHLYRLYRRVPVGGSRAGIYTLCLSLAPRLGMRAVGYFAYFAFSAIVMYLAALVPSLFSAGGGSSPLAVLLAVATMIIAVVANRKEEPFVSRATFRIPWILCILCTVADAVGYLALIFKGDSSADCLMPLYLAVAVVLTCIALVHAIWVGWHWYVRRWTRAPGAFDVADIPIYIER